MKLTLIILDGYGLNVNIKGNAINQAKRPTIDEFEAYYPFLSLQASGVAAGLPWGEPGNSEVGHALIGAGRIIYQHLQRINNAIKDGGFYNSPALLKIVQHIKANNSRLHLIGLVGSGSVHSYLDHLFALLEFAKKNNIGEVYLHLFTDGRDSPPNEAVKILNIIIEKCGVLGVGKIAGVIGRNYAMDRDEDWQKIEKAYNLLVFGIGEKSVDVRENVKSSYQKGIYDEMIEPIAVLDDRGGLNNVISDNDAVVFFNFREDSARELTRAFVQEKFKFFERKKINNLLFATMIEYERGLPTETIMPSTILEDVLGEVLANNNKSQLRIAETEKYAHVSLFFNGGREEKFSNEERILIQSLSVNKIEKNPEMKAKEITELFFDYYQKKTFDFAVVNFANPDMLGHAGNLEAAIKGVEVVDECLSKIVKLVLERDDILIIVSDHGNAEEMINYRTGEIDTEHNINPVPFWVIANKYRRRYPRTKQEINKIYNESSGILADVAPTVLNLLGLEKPAEMTGNNLLENSK